MFFWGLHPGAVNKKGVFCSFTATHNFPQMTKKHSLEVYTCIYIYIYIYIYICIHKSHLVKALHLVINIKNIKKTHLGKQTFPMIHQPTGKHHRSATCFVKPSYRRLGVSVHLVCWSSQVRSPSQAFFWNHQQAIFPVGLFFNGFWPKKVFHWFGQRVGHKKRNWKFGNDQMLCSCARQESRLSKSSDFYVIWIW